MTKYHLACREDRIYLSEHPEDFKKQKSSRKIFENCTPNCISDIHHELRSNSENIIKENNLPNGIGLLMVWELI